MTLGPCSLFHHVVYHPEAAGLRNSLWKTQLQCQLGGNTLQSCGKVLQKAVLSTLLSVSCLSESQNLGVKEARGKNGNVTTHYCTWWATSKILHPVSTTLCFSGLEVSVPERVRHEKTPQCFHEEIQQWFLWPESKDYHQPLSPCLCINRQCVRVLAGWLLTTTKGTWTTTPKWK